MDKVNLAQKLSLIQDHWRPKVIGELNGQEVKLVKCQGEFVWHHHDVEDELFLVVKGRLTMQLRTGDLVLDPGELVIVPHGVEHCPKADAECWVLLLEPKTTLNTGNVVDERTVRELGRV